MEKAKRTKITKKRSEEIALFLASVFIGTFIMFWIWFFAMGMLWSDIMPILALSLFILWTVIPLVLGFWLNPWIGVPIGFFGTIVPEIWLLVSGHSYLSLFPYSTITAMVLGSFPLLTKIDMVKREFQILYKKLVKVYSTSTSKALNRA